jgi:Arc/MetJ-type ribon-helix-helix transcriptional regulator
MPFGTASHSVKWPGFMRTALNISLPEATRSWVEEQVRKHGYGTVSEYIRQLLREEQKRQLPKRSSKT